MTFSDAELFLLGWAIGATVMYFRAKDDKEIATKMLMHLIRDAEARDFIIKQWEAFKKEHGA